ncbi:hypothetical protein [Scytonema sp. PRP1]
MEHNVKTGNDKQRQNCGDRYPKEHDNPERRSLSSPFSQLIHLI